MRESDDLRVELVAQVRGRLLAALLALPEELLIPLRRRHEVATDMPLERERQHGRPRRP